jgi:Type III restriction enzyme, res subunit
VLDFAAPDQAIAEEATQFAQTCNVIVGTPSSLRASPPEVQQALIAECSHLFVDEAHHVPAATWRSIRDQFTATPFREDGKRLGGRIIYAFPLQQFLGCGACRGRSSEQRQIGHHENAIVRSARVCSMEIQWNPLVGGGLSLPNINHGHGAAAQRVVTHLTTNNDVSAMVRYMIYRLGVRVNHRKTDPE